jgi:tetratricopeptide (TPR) repeat protein
VSASLRRLLQVLGFALLTLLCPLLARAEISASAFESANKLYEEGKYKEAATGYAEILKGGQTSAALYFNLGNAFFKSGQIGRAIAAYRLAAQLTPRDPDVRANLQFARNQVQGPTLPPGRWQRWLGRLSLNEWTVLSAVVFWLWLLLLAVRQWRPALRAALRGYALGLTAAALLLCGLTAAAYYQTRIIRTAIVITSEAVVRFGPFAESQSAFTAHDGAELQVLDRKDEWLEVTAGPRRSGWLRRDQVLMPQ